MNYTCRDYKSRKENDPSSIKNYIELIYSEIDQFLNYYYQSILIKNSTQKFDQFKLFLKKLVRLSKCINLTKFESKILEISNFILKNYNTQEYLDLLNKILYHTETIENNQKIWRECSIMKDRKCRNYNIKDLILKYYCSEKDYTSINDVVNIIKIFQKGSINKEKQNLCKFLSKLIDENTKMYSSKLEEQIRFWNEMKISKIDIYNSLNIIKDAYENKNSFDQIFKRLYNNIKIKKYINDNFKIPICTIIFFIVFNLDLFSYISSLCRQTASNNSSNDSIDQIMAKLGFGSLNTPIVTYNNKIDISLLIKNGYNLEIISGDDRFISLEDYKSALRSLNFKSDKYFDYSRFMGNIHGLKIPIVPNNSVKELNNLINNIFYKIVNNEADKIEKIEYINAKTSIDSIQSHKNTKYNPLNELLERTDTFVNNKLIKAKKLISTSSNINDIVIKSITDLYFKGINNDMLTRSIPVVREFLNDKYYILDGHERWIAASIISENIKLNCSVFNLPKGMTIKKFIAIALEIPGAFIENKDLYNIESEKLNALIEFHKEYEKDYDNKHIIIIENEADDEANVENNTGDEIVDENEEEHEEEPERTRRRTRRT